MLSSSRPAVVLTVLLVCGPCAAQHAGAQTEPLQLHEDFRVDPGWEGVNNHVVARGGPTVAQDFGYRSGTIGGTVWSSTTPAAYGMKVGPFSFADRLSASGRIRILKATGRSGMYLGFYNASRQGWRPWSALMLQLTGSQRGETLRGKTAGTQVWFSSLSANWQADVMVTDLLIPADGKDHDWSFAYDPEARIDLNWPHPNLRQSFRNGRLSEAALLENARKLEPGLERAELRRRLEAAAEQGLMIYDPRRGTDYWELQPNPEQFRGAVTLRIDGSKPQRMYLAPGHRDEPLVLDRFGVVNWQTNGYPLEFALTDLTINGHRVSLAQDPGWEGWGNHVSFVETDFHSRQDFGFRETNWAGKEPGEAGGVFWRTEPVDPLHGYYAADVGELTLDDPLAFSGSIAFIEGQPDSGVAFGYFDRRELMKEISDESRGHPLAHSLGIVVEGPTRVGYYFSALCAPDRKTARQRHGPLLLPERQKHAFSFAYDPKANGGVGRITLTLDQSSFGLDLTPAQRAADARFDRFGLWNIRTGGKHVEFYLDDLTYTSRKPKGPQAVGKPPEPVVVPYPEGGRRY